jgi:hypothetical protein
MLDKRDELKDRVEAKRHELMAKYNELKADTRHEAIEARNKLKKKLDDLERYIKAGWDNLDAGLRSKLDKWLEHD